MHNQKTDVEMKACTSIHFHLPLCLIPQIICNYFILLILFQLWLAIAIIFFFLVWLLIMKADLYNITIVIM